MQKLTPRVVTALNNLPGFPPKPTTNPPQDGQFVLGDWIDECRVRPEVANFAALPLVGNQLGDLRASLADQLWYIWDGAAWQAMAGGGGGLPAPPVSSIQFNNAGAFGGSANLTWSGTTLTTSNGAAAADILVARDNATSVFTVQNEGRVLVKNTTDATASFQVQNAAAATVLDVDTTNARVGVGTNAPTTALDLAAGQLAVPNGSAAAPSIALRSSVGLDTGIFGTTTPTGVTVVTNESINTTFNGTEDAGFRDLTSGAINATQFFVGKSAVDFGVLTLGQRVTPAWLPVAGEAIALSSAMIEGHIDDTVTGLGSAAALYTYGSSLGGTVASSYIVRKARGTQAVPAAVQSGDIIGSFSASGFDGTSFVPVITQAPHIRFTAADTFSAAPAAAGALIDFYTVPTGTTTPTQRLRIGAGGNVGIGTFAGVTEPSQALDVFGQFKVTSGGDIVAIRGQTTTFPAANAAGVLTNNGAGTLSWSAAPAATTIDIPSTAQETLAAGDLVCFNNNGGTPNVRKADATNADGRLNPVGFAVAAAANPGDPVTVRVAGVADVPAARFDVAPAPGDVGKRVFASTTSGQIVLSAAGFAVGDIVQRVGVLVDGSANPKVLVQIGDPVLL